jgi:redox-sensitive bicupin YhaK (pirin superfamily)
MPYVQPDIDIGPLRWGFPGGGGVRRRDLPSPDTMMKIRRASERGVAEHGWLHSRHTFSFADYYDPAWMGFRGLRVINDDRVDPAAGFPTHGHRDMEILSYVLEGALEHKDSTGTGAVIRPGDVQRMTAGSGVRHSEFNASKTEPVHFLQIWIEPATRGLPPGYEQKTFADTKGKLRLVASPDAAEGSVTVHADVRVYASTLAEGDRTQHVVPAGRHAWIHVAKGAARIGGESLAAGDAAYTSDAGAIAVEGISGAELLVFDLA